MKKDFEIERYSGSTFYSFFKHVSFTMVTFLKYMLRILLSHLLKF